MLELRPKLKPSKPTVFRVKSFKFVGSNPHEVDKSVQSWLDSTEYSEIVSFNSTATYSGSTSVLFVVITYRAPK